MSAPNQLLLLEPEADLERVRLDCRRRGLTVRVYGDSPPALLVASGPAALGALPGVARVLPEASLHPCVDVAPAAVDVGGVSIGAGQPPVLIAGPCAVEDAEQIDAAAALAAASGARLLRGGAFKPRSSPYSFQGLELEGLRLLRAAADRHGLALVTEVMGEATLDVVAEHADMLQIGSRTMQAYALLKAVARAGRPVLLKRGMAATVEEWLLAAEYLLAGGAPGVVLCERGIRTFETVTRNTLDLCAVAHLVERHRLPVVVDPSHAAGRRDLVPRLARAALACGAHGVMIEVHPDPGRARCDAEQALGPDAALALGAELVRWR